MAIVIHMDRKEYYKKNWMLYKAPIVVHQHLKWKDVSHFGVQSTRKLFSPRSSSLKLQSPSPGSTAGDKLVRKQAL
eukprot:IDg5710t1